MTDEGTDRALLLLVRFTVIPELGAAAVRFTVQLSLPAPVIDVLAQLTPESEGVPEFHPWPCNRIVRDHSAVVAVLTVETLSSAVVSTAVVGSK